MFFQPCAKSYNTIQYSFIAVADRPLRKWHIQCIQEMAKYNIYNLYICAIGNIVSRLQAGGVVE